MERIFKITYDILIYFSNLTGFTYKEINIIVWFILIPLSWLFLLDRIYKKKFTIFGSICILIALLFIDDFTSFSNWLFQKSVDFLNLFNTLGSNYTSSSVIICVLIPIVIYAVLIYKAFRKKTLTLHD